MNNLCDLHTHSELSNHGYSSLSENIKQAQSLGLKYYGISEHQPDSFGVGANSYAIDALDHVPEVIDGMHILKGCEFNVLEDGKIDLSKIIDVGILDYGIASIHDYAYHGEKNVETITKCYLNALDYDFIKILGHPNDNDYKFNYYEVLKKCHDKKILVEVNNSKLKNQDNINNMIEILNICKELRLPIIVNSDAHIIYEIGNVERAFKLLNEINFPNELVLNFNEDLIKEYFY